MVESGSDRIHKAMESLLHAFIWNDTPPGLEYWDGVYNNLFELYIKEVRLEEVRLESKLDIRKRTVSNA